MNTPLIKNIPHGQVINLAEYVSCIPEQTDRKSLVKNDAVKIFLFGFGKGSELKTHTTNGDALVQITEGTALIIIKKDRHILHAGQSIVLPSNIPHSVHAEEPFSMLLTIIHPFSE